MGKKNPKSEEKKVRASDFSNFQTSDSRPTGLHQIFASFNSIPRPETRLPTKTESSTLSKPNRIHDDTYSDTSETQADILVLLNKLTKKDSITKLKALETFNELVESTPEHVLEEFIVDIIHLFKKSSVVEPVKKIRLEFGLLLSKVSNKLKRKLQQYLESFITHWWICMHDESSDIAYVYVEAFKNLFSTTLSDQEFELKTLKILNFYFTKMAQDYLEFLNRDVDSYSKEWLDTFGKSSQNSASIADMHNRLFYSVLHSLMKLFVYARVHKQQISFDLDQLVHEHFVSRVTSISKLSFKKRLSCVLMLVEMVKVLPKESHRLLEQLISYSVDSIKTETEPALIYHNVRLICACTRENSGSLSSFLPNYEKIVVSLLTNFNGEYGNKMDLFTLFPSLYMYIDPEYFNEYRQNFENILAFLTDLMKKEAFNLRRNAYTFDLVSFRNLGTRMLCCYYKLLLLSKKKSPEFITLPLKKLAPIIDNSRDFLWNYPAVMTEYVSESNILSDPSFSETIDKILSYSDEKTVLVVSILDNLLAKYSSEMTKSYPGIQKVYEDLMATVSKKLPESLESHLKHTADLTLDIEQLVQLLKKNPVSLPHHIPLILFKSHSNPYFLEDYNLLLQVYRNLKSTPLTDCGSEELDPRLFLFYSVIEIEHNHNLAKRVLERQFDVDDVCTYFLANEFLKGCKGLGYSNELVEFAKRHVNLELFQSLTEQVHYEELKAENKVVYQGILITYQLYENKCLDFEGEYDKRLVENILTSFLYLFLKNDSCDYVRFGRYVFKRFTNPANTEACVDESCLMELDALSTSVQAEFEVVGKNLGSLLGSIFDANLVSEILNVAINFVKKVDPKTLYKRSYYLLVNLYVIPNKANDTSLNVDVFLDMFVKVLVGSGYEFCTKGYGDFITLTNMYRLDETEISRKFLEIMVTQFMEERYETMKKLHDNVNIFQYFYKALRVNLPKTGEIIKFVKSHYTTNLTSSYLLASLYTVEELSEDIMKLELQIFKLLTSNLSKKLKTGKLEEGESYTFLNNMNLSTQLISNYKHTNSTDKLQSIKLVELFSKPVKLYENQDLSPHNEELVSNLDYNHQEQDSSDDYPLDLSDLLSNTLTVFFALNLHHSFESSWAYLSILDFLSLFPSDLYSNLKNDLYALNISTFKHLYSGICLYGVSTQLLSSFTTFTLENGLLPSFKLGDELDFKRVYKHFGYLDDGFPDKLDHLSISSIDQVHSLSYWLPLCLKFGFECLKVDDVDTVSSFAESVYSLLQYTYTLRPSSYYVNVYVSRLWECRSFYPKISESSIFCSFPNMEHVVMINSFPPNDLFNDLNFCKVDAYKLLYSFNNYSDKDEEQNEEELNGNDVNGSDEAEDLSVEDLQYSNESKSENIDRFIQQLSLNVSMADVKNGYDLMKLYFSLIIGPYLTSKIMTTHLYLHTSDLQEIQKCLISWLTVFNMHGKYKRLGNLNCANALVKLLTERPHELGKYVNEAFQDNLSEALLDTKEYVDMSFIYSSQFNLAAMYPEAYYERDYYRNSLLDIFLQLLILCLEKMLIKDEEFCETVKMLYYKAAKIFPMQVSEMWNNCKNSYVKKNIKKFTKHEVTQKLITHELETLKTLAEDLTVFYDVTKREVTAKLFIKNEINAKISIRVPSAFPLEPLTFVSNDTKKNHKWIMFSHSEANRSGIAQGLLLWYNNVVKYYQGIDECPICYSIVHTQFNSIPTKSCKVCKYKFHKECLFKWFRNAAKAKCPLCQSQVSFL